MWALHCIDAVQHGKMIPVTKWQHGYIVQHGHVWHLIRWSWLSVTSAPVIQGKSGFPSQGVGGVTRDREIGNKASRENFLFFESVLPLHIVIPYLTCIPLADVIHRAYVHWMAQSCWQWQTQSNYPLGSVHRLIPQLNRWLKQIDERLPRNNLKLRSLG